MSKKAAKHHKNAAVLTQRDTIQKPLNIMRAGSTKRPPITRILPAVTVIMQRITPRKPLKRTWKNTTKQHENGPNGPPQWAASFIQAGIGPCDHA